MSTQQDLSKHVSWVDACRLFSIFGVFVIHIAGPVFNQYHSIPLDQFLAANAIDSLVRACVPLFTMLSGALLLGKEATINMTARRISRVAVPLVFWSFIYTFWVDSWTNKPLDFFGAFSSMLQTPAMYHLWFVYMIVGVYIVMPILPAITKTLIADKKIATYFFVLWFVVNSITVYYPVELIQKLYLSNFLGWPGYFVLGYYLTQSEYLHRISVKWVVLVFLLASLCTFLISWYLNISSVSPNVMAREYFSPNVVIASISAFLWFRRLKIPDFLVRPFAYMAGMVFPMYFMHIFIISMLTGKNHGLGISPYFIHPIIGILVLSVLIFLVSFLITVLLRFIPYSSKVFG